MGSVLLGALRRAQRETPSAKVTREVRKLGRSAERVMGRMLDALGPESFGTAQLIELLGRSHTLEACRQLVRVLVHWPLDMTFRAEEQLLRQPVDLAVRALLWALPDHIQEVAPTLAECGAPTRDPVVRHHLRELIHRDLELGAACARGFKDPTLVGDVMLALYHRDGATLGLSAVAEALDTVESYDVDPGPIGRRRMAEAQARMIRV